MIKQISCADPLGIKYSRILVETRAKTQVISLLNLSWCSSRSWEVSITLSDIIGNRVQIEKKVNETSIQPFVELN